MISVNAGCLYTGCDELKSVYGSLAILSSVISDIQKQLSDESEMSDMVHLLHCVNYELYEQIEQCRWLCQCVDTVCQYYSSCENRVLDYGENAVVYYPHPPTAFVELSATMDVLREFSFTSEGSESSWLQANLK